MRASLHESLVFAFIAFTKSPKLLQISDLSVKENSVKAVKADGSFAFTRNQLFLSDLSRMVKE